MYNITYRRVIYFPAGNLSNKFCPLYFIIRTISCCGNRFLSFPRKRESILLSGKAAFVAMDPCFRRGDRLSTTGTN